MDRWRSESNPAKQRVLTIACALIGMVLVVGFRHFAGPGMTDSKAAFLLGCLLLVIGILGLLFQGKQVIVVDPLARVVRIEDKNLWGTKSRTIAFGDISAIRIGYMGKKSNFVQYHYLLLTLRTGEKYPLFAPGRFYDGASDRTVVEAWQSRLQHLIGQ